MSGKPQHQSTGVTGSILRRARDSYAFVYSIISRGNLLFSRFRYSLRYKLLLLVLLPLLIFVPLIMAFALYRTYSFAQQQLNHKVKTDINMAMLAFSRKQSAYLHAITELAESHVFYSAYKAHDKTRIKNLLQVLKVTEDLDFIHVTDLHGKWLYDDSVFTGRIMLSPLTESVIRSGQPRVGLEVYAVADLLREHQALVSKAGIAGTDTDGTKSVNTSQHAMVLRAVYPIENERGQTVALMEGGVLLNENTTLITAIKDRVYGPQVPANKERDLISIILGRHRIATNLVKNEQSNPANAADQLPSMVEKTVLNKGENWAGFINSPGGEYLCAYSPLRDFQGKIIGMLEAGYLAAPLRSAYSRDIYILSFMLLLIVLVTASLAILGARRIFKPIERIAEVIRAQENGIDRRIGEINSRDEIGAVARRFDHMLDLLHERNATIQQAAIELERQVQERTRELRLKNEDLQQSIDLLGKTRQQLVWAEKFAALGELTAGIAHEINNPTAVILGNMDVLKEELGEKTMDVQTELDLIYAQVDRIRNIVDNLLKYSRSSPLDTQLKLVDVNEIINDSLLLVQHEAVLKHAKIHTLLRENCYVTIDPQELQQVLINLLLNAVHAIQAQGNIEITTWIASDDEVCILISDDGEGIDPVSIDRIFDPFYTTRSGEGTGLGLSISYGLVNRYGGRLEVDSMPGYGSRFSVYLRRRPKLSPQRQVLFDIHSYRKTMRGL